MKIDHIGYLVKSITKAKPIFDGLGFEAEGDVVYDPLRDIDIQFLRNGDYVVELVAPKSENSVVWDTLKKSGSTPYHICYESENIEASIEEMRAKGFTPVGEALPAVACGGRKVCFLYNRQIGIIELIERE